GADRRGAAHEPAPRRDFEREGFAAELHGLYALLPLGSRELWTRRARIDSPTPVRQSRAGQDHQAGRFIRRVGAVDARRGNRPRTPRTALPHGDAFDRRYGIFGGEDLRHRGLAAESEDLPGNLFVLELRGVPGAPRADPLQT